MFVYKYIFTKYVKQAHGIYHFYGSEDLWKQSIWHAVMYKNIYI